MIRKNGIIAGLLMIVLLSGCASYNAATLSYLAPAVITNDAGIEEKVLLVTKAFDKSDCKKYLDRDVLSKGYQPVQIYLQNNSDKNYIFSPSRISLPCARAEEVAEKVHTSTAGRATGYGAAAVFTCGLFAIPAIVDGVKSSNANEALDSDFACKVAKEQILAPHACLNMIIFVPRDSYQNSFSLTLIDQKTQETKTFYTVAR